MKFLESTKVLAGTAVWSAPLRVLRVPFSNSATVEKDTGVRFQAGDIIEDVRVKVTTEQASSTISVGLNGATQDDADGLIKALPTTAAGWLKVNDEAETASRVGAFLQGGANGVTEAAAYEGGPNRLLITEDVPLTYTTTNHAIVGYIYVFFRTLDDGASS